MLFELVYVLILWLVSFYRGGGIGNFKLIGFCILFLHVFPVQYFFFLIRKLIFCFCISLNLRWFTGGGCQSAWHTSAISAILDLGKAAKPYISSQSTIDPSGGSTICNYVLVCFSCNIFFSYSYKGIGIEYSLLFFCVIIIFYPHEIWDRAFVLYLCVWRR